MSDRELLEAAAKAAGLGFTVPVFGVPPFMGLRLIGGALWNPLTDDGDALRLAVKLLFEIDMDSRSIAIRHQTGVKILQAFNKERCATARRAIVRAAAEIGRSMK